MSEEIKVTQDELRERLVEIGGMPEGDKHEAAMKKWNEDKNTWSIAKDFKMLDLTNLDFGDKANLKGADLEGAKLMGANLQGANLWTANLKGAELMDANLWRANLRGADLKGANLQGANLIGADLQKAGLRKANLWDADLRGANLSGVIGLGLSSHLYEDHLLVNAKYNKGNEHGDRDTIFPEGFDPASHRMKLDNSPMTAKAEDRVSVDLIVQRKAKPKFKPKKPSAGTKLDTADVTPDYVSSTSFMADGHTPTTHASRIEAAGVRNTTPKGEDWVTQIEVSTPRQRG